MHKQYTPENATLTYNSTYSNQGNICMAMSKDSSTLDRKRAKRSSKKEKANKSDQTNSTLDNFHLDDILLNPNRSLGEAQFLYKYLENMPFFNDLRQTQKNEGGDDGFLITMCRHLKYERFSAGEVIFTQGDPSKGKYYMVVRGLVQIYQSPTNGTKINKQENKDLITKKIVSDHLEEVNTKPIASPSKFSVEHDRNKAEQKAAKTSNTNNFDYKNQDLNKQIDEQNILQNEVTEGYGFGHAAFKDLNSIRSATAVAATATDLLVIDKDDLKIIAERNRESHIQKKDFLLQFFPHINEINASKIIDNYMYLLKEEMFPLDTIICKEGSIAKKVFILVSGKCQLLKKFVINEFPEAHNIQKDLDQHKRTHKVLHRAYPVCDLEKGAFMGEETLFSADQKYEYTVKVLSHSAVFYSIDRSVFQVRFPRNTIEAVRRLCLKRSESHLKTINNIIQTKFPQMDVSEIGELPRPSILGEHVHILNTIHNAIVISPPVNGLQHHSKKFFSNDARVSEKSQIIEDIDPEEQRLRNRIVEYGRVPYTKDAHSAIAGNKHLPQIENLKALQELQKKSERKIEAKGIDTVKLEEFKSKLLQLCDSQKASVRHRSLLTFSNRPSRAENCVTESPQTAKKDRKLVVRKDEYGRTPFHDFFERNIKHYNSQKHYEALEHRDTSNPDDYRLGFGRDYEINRKKKGETFNKNALQESRRTHNELSGGLRRLKAFVDKYKDRSIEQASLNQSKIKDSRTSRVITLSPIDSKSPTSASRKPALYYKAAHRHLKPSNSINIGANYTESVNLSPKYSKLLFVSSNQTDSGVLSISKQEKLPDKKENYFSKSLAFSQNGHSFINKSSLTERKETSKDSLKPKQRETNVLGKKNSEYYLLDKVSLINSSLNVSNSSYYALDNSLKT